VSTAAGVNGSGGTVGVLSAVVMPEPERFCCPRLTGPLRSFWGATDAAGFGANCTSSRQHRLARRSPHRCGLRAQVVAIPGLGATGRPTRRGAGRSRALMNPARIETVHWAYPGSPVAARDARRRLAAQLQTWQVNAADAEPDV